MTPLDFLLLSLASYGITYLLTRGDVLNKPRSALIRRWSRKPEGIPFAEALSCPWCMGFWVSASLVIGVSQIRDVPLPGLVGLAVWAVVGLIGEKA